MSTPRKHHFVPISYLAGFTPSGSRKDRLYVLDKATGRQWQSSPGDSGCEHDFYMLEVEDGGDPTALEALFGKVESQGAEAIKLAASHIGFQRVGKNIDAAFRSSINGGMRSDVFGYEGKQIWQEG